MRANHLDAFTPGDFLYPDSHTTACSAYQEGNLNVKIKESRQVGPQQTQLKPPCLARSVLLSLFLLIVLPRSSLICTTDGIQKV